AHVGDVGEVRGEAKHEFQHDRVAVVVGDEQRLFHYVLEHAQTANLDSAAGNATALEVGEGRVRQDVLRAVAEFCSREKHHRFGERERKFVAGEVSGVIDVKHVVVDVYEVA